MSTKVTCWCGDSIVTDDPDERDTFMRFHEVICPEEDAPPPSPRGDAEGVDRG